MRQNVQQLIRKLGDDEFATRETVFEELLRLGRITMPQLREAMVSKDLEIAHRARELIERIEREPSRALPGVAVRLLALRKPKGSAETLLAYLPFAEEDDRGDEVKKALAGLAVREGKLNAALVRALTEASPRLRAAAAEALVQGGGKEGLVAVRKLLRDKAPAVRLRVALALVRDGAREAVPVLIDLLAVASDEQVGQLEDVLSQLAGESAPETAWSKVETDKKKCRDAWAAWWKSNGERVDLTHLTARPLLGFTLVCDTTKHRVFEIDRKGKERWAIDKVSLPADAVVLPGNRVLIAEYSANRVTERDFKGKILWQKQVTSPVSVQRLANGHTFILSDNQAIREVDRSGKEIYLIQNLPPGVRVAYRSRQGHIVYRTGTGECVRVDTTGKRLRSFATHDIPSDIGTLDLAPDGRILVTQQSGNKLIEYDAGGKKIREVNAPQPSTAMALPNGHYLVASHQAQRVFELDRNGKVVWERKGAGHAYRARGR